MSISQQARMGMIGEADQLRPSEQVGASQNGVEPDCVRRICGTTDSRPGRLGLTDPARDPRVPTVPQLQPPKDHNSTSDEPFSPMVDGIHCRTVFFTYLLS